MSALFCGITIIGTIVHISGCINIIIIINCKKLLILKEKSTVIEDLQTQEKVVLKNTENTYSRQKNLKFIACLKNHSHNLRIPFCGIFCPNSVAVDRATTPLIRTKSPTNCDAHLAKSIHLKLCPYFSRYCRRVIPVYFLNTFPRWLWEENPRYVAISI